jgi:hypothetical protein
MKKFIFQFIAVVFFTTNNLLSQDFIIKNDKTEIKARIVEIQEEFIKYALFDFPNDPIRDIRISDVFMIVYGDGRRETFPVKSDTEKSEEQTPVVSEKSFQQEILEAKVPVDIKQPAQQKPRTKKPYGFIFGFDAGIHVPLDSKVQEIYGALFRGGIVLGYWGKGFGVESHLNYSYMEGTPITAGSVEEASCQLGMTKLDFSGYWKTRSPRVFFYLGGGFGLCGIKEAVTLSAFGQDNKDVVNMFGFEVHASLGMKLGHFCWQISPTSITSSDVDVNYGGVILSIGVFF